MARKKVTEKNMYCNRREIINENMIAEFSAKKRWDKLIRSFFSLC